MRIRVGIFLVVSLSLAGCPGSYEFDAGPCPIGEEGCRCTGGGLCDTGLICTADAICVSEDFDAGAEPEGGNEPEPIGDAGGPDPIGDAGEPEPVFDAGEPEPILDAGGAPDAGSPLDAGPRIDAGLQDAGPQDAGRGDAGVSDAGPQDAGTADGGPINPGPNDGGPHDAGLDDAGLDDAGPRDAGLDDAGPDDAGPVPAGDGGPTDGGLACANVVQGSVTVANAVDLGQLIGVCEVTGDIIIDAPTLDDDTALASLQRVGGTFEVISAAFSQLDLAALESVGGSFLLASRLNGLEEVWLDALVSVGDALLIDQPDLKTLDLSSLEHVGLNASAAAPSLFRLWGGPQWNELALPHLQRSVSLDIAFGTMETISLPELTSLVATDADGQALHFSALPFLTSLSVPQLAEAATVEISNTSALQTLDLTALARVSRFALTTDGSSSVRMNLLNNAPGVLQTLSLPALERAFGDATVPGGLFIRENAGLVSIDAPLLALAGRLEINGNESLGEFVNDSIETLPEGLAFSRNAVAEALSLPNLESIPGSPTAGLSIVENPLLTTLELDALTSAFAPSGLFLDYAINGNDSLDQCVVDALERQIGTLGACSCSPNLLPVSLCP